MDIEVLLLIESHTHITI